MESKACFDTHCKLVLGERLREQSDRLTSLKMREYTEMKKVILACCFLLVLGFLPLLSQCSENKDRDPKLIRVYDDDGNHVITFADPSGDERYPGFPELLDEVPVDKYDVVRIGMAYREVCEIMGGGGSVGMIGVQQNRGKRSYNWRGHDSTYFLMNFDGGILVKKQHLRDIDGDSEESIEKWMEVVEKGEDVISSEEVKTTGE